jgi:hypothetical protein
MNAPATSSASARHLLCLAASILGLMVLTFSVEPGTVLASSATDVYTEEPPPPTPGKNDNNVNNANNGNGGSSGNQNSGGDSDSGSGDSSGGSTDTSSSGSGDSTGSGSDTPTQTQQFSNGQYNPATDSDTSGSTGATGSSDNSESDDSTITATPASGGDDGSGGGSALPLIIALLIGVPLIAGGGYYAWTRYRVRDEDRDRLKTALSDRKPTGS